MRRAVHPASEASDNLNIVDVSDPHHPYEIATYQSPYQGSFFSGLAVSGDYVYVVGTVDEQLVSPAVPPPPQRGYLWIIDASNPTQPSEAGFYSAEIGSIFCGVAVSGDYAYVVSNVDLQVVDISRPISPTVVASLATPGWDIAIVGNFAYIASNSALQVIDITTPTQPTKAGIYNASTTITDLVVDQNYIYVMIGGGDLRVLDISVAATPVEIHSYSMPVAVEGFAVRGDDIYICNSFGGLFILRQMHVYLPLVLLGCFVCYFRIG